MSQAVDAAQPTRVRASKQAAVASMFKAAKASLGSLHAPQHTASQVANHSSADQKASEQPSDASAAHEQHEPKDTIMAVSAIHNSRCDADQNSLPCGNDAEHQQALTAEMQDQQKDQGWTEAHSRLAGSSSDAHICEQGHEQDAAATGHETQPFQDSDQTSDLNALQSVDLAEQKQILHELWLEKNALSARSAKRPAAVTKKDGKRTKHSSSGTGRQTQLSAMLKKPP